ncbi:hypothetical protein KBB17_02970 [Candidatus Saccharibacteria bacterium]|nr:hypothetical protein [Candidatus Saccharibacteria bacterium]MBP9132153.1 hypothetical protein [Candidatus Saccharibacteria bacterium]
MVDLLDWFTKKRIITILALMSVLALFIISISVIGSIKNNNKFKRFDNGNISIEVPKSYKSSLEGGLQIVLSDQTSNSKESIKLSTSEGGYSKEKIDSLELQATTSSATGRSEKLDNISTTKFKHEGYHFLQINDTKKYSDIYITTVYILGDKDYWQIDIEHSEKSLLANNLDRIFKSFEQTSNK